MIWTCQGCGLKIKLAAGITPSICCVCGCDKLTTPESLERLETYRRYDEELKQVTDELNRIREIEKPLKDRYSQIMQYFAVQKKRGLITGEEYRGRAEMFQDKKKRPKKEAI